MVIAKDASAAASLGAKLTFEIPDSELRLIQSSLLFRMSAVNRQLKSEGPENERINAELRSERKRLTALIDVLNEYV